MLNVRWNDNLLSTDKLILPTTNLSKMYTSINDEKRDTPIWVFKIRKKNNAYNS